MIISTKRGTPPEEIDKIIKGLEAQGVSVTLIRGTDYNVFGLVGDTTKLDEKNYWCKPMGRQCNPLWQHPTKRPTACSTKRIPVVDVSGCKGGAEKRKL